MPAVKQTTSENVKAGQTMPIALLMMFVGIAVIVVTIELSRYPGFAFIAVHRDSLVSAEIGICSIILVELIGRVIVRSFTARGMAGVGHSFRAILRGAAYIALTIAIVSVLAASPALAISIGTVSGVIIGFAAQNLIGNVFAGMLLAIMRPVRIGDQITVGTAIGRVKEIDLIYTILDSDDSWYYVPSMAMFANSVMKKKLPGVKGP